MAKLTLGTGRNEVLLALFTMNVHSSAPNLNLFKSLKPSS